MLWEILVNIKHFFKQFQDGCGTVKQIKISHPARKIDRINKEVKQVTIEFNAENIDSINPALYLALM